MNKINRAIEGCFLPLAGCFILLLVLKEIGVFSLPVSYPLLAFTLPVLAVPGLMKLDSSQTDDKATILASLAPWLAMLLALSVRIFSMAHSSIPLGYDPGFYKYAIDLYQGALPAIPEAELATWVKQMFEQGLFVLADALHAIAGTDSSDLLMYLFPLLGAIVVLPLFVVVRSLFGRRAGILACFLYAVSYTQFAAFALFYVRNVIGLIFLLLAIYSLEKKNDWLTALMFAALGIFHRPEFLLFALILVGYFIFNRRRGLIIASVGAGVMILPFWIPRLPVYWEVVSARIGGGTLFGFDTYALASLAYLPFACIGVAYLLINRRVNSILIYFFVTCAIVLLQLFFFNRFIIMLDLAVLMVAAVGIERVLMQGRGAWNSVGVAVAVLLVAASALPTLAEANDVRPRIDSSQMDAVEWIKDNTESDAFVLTTSSDAPWVLGWGQRRVIAPGLFEWYIQTEDEWFAFFSSKDPESARAFVRVYEGPVYIFSTDHNADFIGLDKFESAYFEKVHGDSHAVVYKYVGGG